MAKECANCGCKLGFLSGDHLNGLLCDGCFNELGGPYLHVLDNSSNAVAYEECYHKIIVAIEGNAKQTADKEKIRDSFYEYISHRHQEKTGISLSEFSKRHRDYIKEQEEKALEEIKKQEYAKSFNEFYEYDVVTILNENHGQVDKEKMIKILAEKATQGWKLHTIYSNELGKNAVSILGLGVNATACEDVLIFERRIQETEEN